jgi:hypothetical protein
MPLMKALAVDKRSQLSYPSMRRNPKQQDTDNVLLRSETDDCEPSTLLPGDIGGNNTPHSQPSDGFERDQFHFTFSAHYNNPRDIFTSARTLLSAVGVTGPVQSLSDVSDSTIASRPQSLQLSPRIRHAPPKRLLSQPQLSSLPTVAPTAFASCKHLQSESTLTAFWDHLAEHKYVNTQEFWLALYFFLNLSLTLYNKVLLVHFPYPYTVTALHALCGTVGGWSLLARGFFVQKRLSMSDSTALVMFSVLYAMNIAISNVSLNLVTVPVSLPFSDSPRLSAIAHRFPLCCQFHQVVRAATPIFTIILSSTMFGNTFTPRKILSLIPVVLGVALASVSTP